MKPRLLLLLTSLIILDFAADRSPGQQPTPVESPSALHFACFERPAIPDAAIREGLFPRYRGRRG